MKRFIAQKLLKWKEQTSRKPLLLRGARQVGKTYSILDFGNSHFSGNTELFFWARAARSSTAEVDYPVTKDGIICPIEVKSAASGRLRSLHLLLESYPNIQTGYVCSTAPYTELPGQKLIFLPLYYAGSFTPHKPVS